MDEARAMIIGERVTDPKYYIKEQLKVVDEF
jgi:hypothetical protein